MTSAPPLALHTAAAAASASSTPRAPHAPSRRGLARRLAAAAAAAVAIALPTAAAHAAALYANFDPLQAAPVDYDTTRSAAISGYCASAYCPWINVYSASFQFTAAATGVAATAWLPLQALSTYPGAERFYRITIANAAGEVMAQGGLLGRYVPLGAMNVYEFALDRVIESGQVLSADDELLAGETYTAYFHQRFGSMSQTSWMASDEAAAPGQATQYCRTNVGGGCAYWEGYWASVPDAPLGFLPALALADGNGFTAAPAAPPGGSAVPEPATLALAALGLIAGATRRKTSREAPRRAASGS